MNIMIDFDQILLNIGKEYNVRRFSMDYAQIEFDILFDGYNYIFIGVLYENGEVILTDFADYTPLCDWSDEEVPNVERICEKYGITFRNFHIECQYHSNDDIKNYIDCLLALKEKYIK